jgi:hypothetical protein
MQAEALRLQAKANEESVANSRNQINSLTSTISQLGARSDAALEALNRQQESLIHLQNTQGRRLNQEAGLIQDMDRQIGILHAGEEALAAGRETDAASILTGVDNQRINDIASNIERRRRELNSLPSAPTGDPRRLANTGTSGPSRRLVAANSNVVRQAGIQSRQQIEAEAQARREAEARQRNDAIARIESQLSQGLGLGQSQGQTQRVAVGASGGQSFAMSPAGPVPAGPVPIPVAQAVPAGEGPVDVPPLLIKQKISLGPPPEPLNFSFMSTNTPIPPKAIMPSGQINPGQASQLAARAISASEKPLPDSPTNKNAEIDVLEKRVKELGKTIDLEYIRDMKEVDLRNRFLRLNGLPPWDFTRESYVEFIIRSDLLMGTHHNYDEKARAIANYREKTRANSKLTLKKEEQDLLTEFENHAPGFRPVENQKMTLERFARELNLSIDEARPHYIAFKQRLFEKSQAENYKMKKNNNFTIPDNSSFIPPVSPRSAARYARALKFPLQRETTQASEARIAEESRESSRLQNIRRLLTNSAQARGSRSNRSGRGGPGRGNGSGNRNSKNSKNTKK